jgi:hypothetical protein
MQAEVQARPRGYVSRAAPRFSISFTAATGDEQHARTHR